MDLTLVGGTFTWSNNRDLLCWFRIDRFLDSLDREAQFPGACPKGACLNFDQTTSLFFLIVNIFTEVESISNSRICG